MSSVARRRSAIADSGGDDDEQPRRSRNLTAQLGALKAASGSTVSVAELADRDLERAAQVGAWLPTRNDPAWAGLGFDDLDQHDNPASPVAVWVRGAVDPISMSPRVGVVGSRAVSARGTRITGEIAEALAARGVHLVSGGAFGVDILAHRAALNHGTATTLVSAAGIDRVYPATHAELFDTVAARGAVVSEYPPGDSVDRSWLPARNRLVAAMSRQLVIPEAGIRSGTLTTARWAHRLHRPILAVPGPAATSGGCQQLIADGHARPVHSVTDVLTALKETAAPEPDRRYLDPAPTGHRSGGAPAR
ncbi:DNA-processing protein DprA [Nocardia takedensis]